MSETQVCCHCELPIHTSETGLRHYGDRTAHSEERCYWLLHAHLAAAQSQRCPNIQISADGIHFCEAFNATLLKVEVDHLKDDNRRLAKSNAELREALRQVIAGADGSPTHGSLAEIARRALSNEGE